MQSYEYVTQPTFCATIYKDLFNQRLRVDDVRGNILSMMEYLGNELNGQHYEKIIIKARALQSDFFLERGFIKEGQVNEYFNGNQVLFMSKFLTTERRNSMYWVKEDEILQAVQAAGKQKKLQSSFINVLIAGQEQAELLADLYQEVFPIYPVPLHNPEYIKDAMKSGTIFAYIQRDGKIISAASAEISTTYNNAELTDCATRISYRKGGYMKHLLARLEQELIERGIYCAYTIARALSYGMNAVFHQLDYQYRGRLANNCFIFDKIEDMNIWEKNLSIES
ncbi:putative beta-lysine N-acetyltransferase [Rossellomorea aquimaris]|uniref:putative beta-lysine N-acetyltransferase n=1 Tax=Rossellomorea aquimaris TaxID=189382 RepID=UPI0007D0AB4D|nr:putative beta-lysine N-acetyltransferase [Rossellomorea aquimaris]